MDRSPHLSTLKMIISRHRVLEQIDTGVRGKRELHENLDTSRTTIDRTVRELGSENVLHRQNGNCEFTRFGRLAYRQFCEASDAFETLSAASELLAILPEDSTLDVEFLQEADVK